MITLASDFDLNSMRVLRLVGRIHREGQLLAKHSACLMPSLVAIDRKGDVSQQV